jgi:RNA polymerase primary sigma factor
VNLDELLSTHKGFITEVACRYRRFGVPLEDLINEGAVGLLEAAQRFDPSRGTRFLTYASYWIHKQILNALDHQSRVVRVPDYRLKQIRQALSAERALLQRLGRPPTPDEIRSTMRRQGGSHMPLLVRPMVELSIESAPETIRPSLTTLADRTTPSPESSLLHDETTTLVRRALDLLTPRERRIIVERYGLADARRRSLREVAADLGLSREGVRKIEMAARSRIARFLAERTSMGTDDRRRAVPQRTIHARLTAPSRSLSRPRVLPHEGRFTPRTNRPRPGPEQASMAGG